MGIARSQMRRQLYGIGNLVTREQYGLGSSLKKFVRNIIPNEVSKVATTIAPFIAPFDPATAALMSSVGTFDQTGSISGGLKAGALTYGGGQLARYIGGAGFQGLPGTEGFAGQSLLSPQAYSGGIMQALDPRTKVGLTMPTGTQTGLGKFLSGQGTPEVTPVGDEAARKAAGEEIAKIGRDAAARSDINFIGEGIESGFRVPDYKGPGIDFIGEGIESGFRVPDYKGPGLTVTELGAKDNLKNILTGSNVTENAFELLKKGAEEVFYTTDKQGNRVLDKKAVFAALAGASSFIEAKKVADDNGISLTKEQYEAAKAKKRTEYDATLANFFTKRTTAAKGGRIGYRNGTKPTYKDFEKFMQDRERQMDEMNRQQLLDEFKDYMNRNAPVEAANGGRIGYANGSDKKPAIPADDFKKIIEEFMKNQEKQEKIRRENKAHGGRMKYKEAGIVSLTDEDSGVIYRDPSGKPISKQQAIKAFNEMAIQEDIEKNKIVPKPKPKSIQAKGKLTGILKLAGAMEPKQGKEYFDSSVLTMMEESGMNAKEINNLIEQIQKEVLNEETRITQADGTAPTGLTPPAPPPGAMVPTPEQMEKMKREIFNVTNNPDILLKDDPIEVAQEYQQLKASGRLQAAQGGRMHYALGDGVMSLPIRDNGAGVKELDLRENGGFIPPIGVKEKADDIPAMLSNNEFVFTADAVGGADPEGKGDRERGAKQLYAHMKYLENKGKIA